MFKWVRIFGAQYLGFWAFGLIIFALQEVPYMVMPFFHLQSNPIMEMRESSVFLDICEKVLGSSCIAMLLFIVHNDAKFFSITAGERLFFLIAAAVLLLNYFGWFLYFTGHQSAAVMLIFIVALPPLLYLFVGLWRKNIPLAVTACVFLIVHFVHVSGNFKLE